jgi:hypothetical protein
MHKITWPILGAFIALTFVYAAPVLADSPAEGAAAANMPDRERDLIAILMDVRKQYQTSHSASPAKDARLDMQVRVVGFMRKDQEAKDWTGIVKSHGTTPEDTAWIEIEIADGITLRTWQSSRDDLNGSTLMQRHTQLFTDAQAAKIGQRVVFSARILNSVLAGDDDMVLHPQFIARFRTLRLAQ